MSALVIVVIALVLAVLVLAGVVWFVMDSNNRVRRFARSTDLIPGQPGRAPAEWATSTAAEAQLHQRIRYAIADVHQAPGAHSTPEVIAARDDLDKAVFELDDQLIAVGEMADEGAIGVIDSRVVEKDDDDEDHEPDRVEQAAKAAEGIDSPKARKLRAIEQTILVLEALPKKIWDARPDAAVADLNSVAKVLRGK
ncbi:hypothetical protein GOEFS_092_00400 [Gordonia effusa NBRC 100432]|uniref:Uncharacterized protein n=1 Tax=Gordonia effusa NBRC 100432 TaxID=1077974 RepID=H0R3G4_9ACTN|nr:hypothetical protein [Gordonia effusa]GAB19615.1 hypothetical protein GOEFS_092_00400 [Gordonia effusa NBRC 100432]